MTVPHDPAQVPPHRVDTHTDADPSAPALVHPIQVTLITDDGGPEALQARAQAAALLQGVAALPHLGVIRAQGAEAAKFLHSQLTHDFILLPEGRARLAGYCSVKGRLLASFIAVRLAPDDFALVVSRDILAPTMKRLQMFILRTQVKLTDATDAFALRGLAGDVARAVLGVEAPAMPEPWTDKVAGPAHAVALYPADSVPRALWLAPAGTEPPSGPELPTDHWLWSEVRSGVATITAPVVDAFVPQMLNYELLDGVSFKKGCYPGQEVVARAQYRGQVKRRAALARCHLTLGPGQDVVWAGKPDAEGQVVAVQADLPPRGEWILLATLPQPLSG
jgi:folate-binding protein YgfZ